MSAMELEKTIQKNLASLKLYLRFESGAELVDSSGNSHTLTAIGTPTYSAGKFGQAVDLATNKGFSIVDHADVKPTGNFSINIWLKSSSGSNLTFFQSYSQNTNVAGIWLRIGTNTVNAFIGKNTGATAGTDYKTVTGTIAVNDGNWHMVTLTWDGSNYRLFIDTKLDVTVASTFGPAYAATNYVRVGCGNTTGTNIDFFNGSLDDGDLFNGLAISTDVMKELFEGRYVGEFQPESGLVAGYHLENETDFSGNNNHLTNTGAVTFVPGRIGKAASFNGSTQKLQVSNNLGIDGGNITISGWFKISSLPAEGTQYAFCGQGAAASSNTGNRIYYRRDSGVYTIRFRRTKFGVSNTDVAFDITLDTSKWYYLVMTYDTANIRGYVNGNLVGTTAITGNGSSGGTAGFAIGETPETYGPYPGLGEEVKVYNIVKSDNWVRQQLGLGVGKFY